MAPAGLPAARARASPKIHTSLHTRPDRLAGDAAASGWITAKGVLERLRSSTSASALYETDLTPSQQQHHWTYDRERRAQARQHGAREKLKRQQAQLWKALEERSVTKLQAALRGKKGRAEADALDRERGGHRQAVREAEAARIQKERALRAKEEAERRRALEPKSMLAILRSGVQTVTGAIKIDRAAQQEERHQERRRQEAEHQRVEAERQRVEAERQRVEAERRREEEARAAAEKAAKAAAAAAEAEKRRIMAAARKASTAALRMKTEAKKTMAQRVAEAREAELKRRLRRAEQEAAIARERLRCRQPMRLCAARTGIQVVQDGYQQSWCIDLSLSICRTAVDARCSVGCDGYVSIALAVSITERELEPISPKLSSGEGWAMVRRWHSERYARARSAALASMFEKSPSPPVKRHPQLLPARGEATPSAGHGKHKSTRVTARPHARLTTSSHQQLRRDAAGASHSSTPRSTPRNAIHGQSQGTRTGTPRTSSHKAPGGSNSNKLASKPRSQLTPRQIKLHEPSSPRTSPFGQPVLGGQHQHHATRQKASSGPRVGVR